MTLRASNLPTTRPSLTLDFAKSRRLDPRITFARNSIGTVTNSSGQIVTVPANVPRFDHNPTTGESLGLLVEEQRTNLRLNSATYQPTSGGTPAAYTIDQVAPDGTTTGSRQTAATPRTFEDYTGIANALYTFSFYCRVTSGTAAFSIQLKNAASDTLITSDTSPVATTTWRRFTISGTTAGATPGARVEIVGVVPGFVFWGAQLEAGATPSSYIPTTTAAATRSADVASITGTNFGVTRTNLLVRSEEFENASWARVNVITTANTTTAPNGTITADSVTPNTVTTLFYTQQNFTTTASTTYAWSVYVKANGFSWVFLDAFDGSNHRTWFDLTNGVIGTVEAGNTSTITSVGNGWYRCTLTRSSAGGLTSYAVAIVSGNNSLSGTGNSSNGIYLWGAQLETGSAVTPYIQSPSVFTSRASSGTYVGSNGVLQTAVTNLSLRSEKLDDAALWNVIGSGATLTATTDVAAPNGAMTAWTLTSSGVAAQIQQVLTGISGATYTGSFYIRRRSGTGTVNIRVSENINTPLVGVTSEWQRFSFTATSTSTTIRLGVNLSGIADAVDLWGAQLEQSATVGEYIPTTSAINSAPRFDHSITSSARNLLLRSEEFDDAGVWAKVGTTVSTNSITSPNGALTADTLVEDTSTGTHRCVAAPTIANTTVCTVSVYAKTAGRTHMRLSVSGGLAGELTANLSNGTVAASSGATNPTVQSVGDGWYRVSFTTAASTGTSAQIGLSCIQGTSTSSYTGDGTSGIYLWGAQLEQSATVGPYVPTTTAAATSNTTESLGLLVEEQRTNLLLRSEEFNDAAWTTLALNATVSANQTTAPNGATIADSISDDAVNNVHYISQSVAVAAATTYTFSCFLRAGTSNFGYLSLSGGGPGWGDTFVVNLSTGVGNVQAGSFGSTSIQAFANGWYRAVVTKITTGSGSPQLRIGVAQSLSVTSYSGSGSTIFVWGAQLEAGAFPTSYIPTTTAAATRAADISTSVATSVFGSPWYRQDEGTMFAETRAAGATNNDGISGAAACFSNGTNTERIRVSIAAIQTTWISGNTTQASLSSGGGFVANALFRAAAATKANDFAFTINANTVQSSLSGSAPSVSQLSIGTSSPTAGFLNGTIKRLTYWPQRLPNPTLQTLTQ